MAKGTIDQYDNNKKSGFIKVGETKKVYFRFDEISRESLKFLDLNASVEFDVKPGTPGAKWNQAVNIRINPNRHVEQTRETAKQNSELTPPYHFVPIPVADGKVLSVTDSPVFHDGLNPESEDLLSGEIRCSLTALTPLLVGNDQYAVEFSQDKDILDWVEKNDAVKEKSVLEPLRLPDGRVLISGSSLKGMLRQSLGALLAAPMEKVGERTYSYRPNLCFKDNSKERYLEEVPAIVDSAPDKNGSGMKIKFASKAIRKRGQFFPQSSGIDGAGALAGLAGKQKPKDRAWLQDVDSSAISVPREVVLHFWETLRHLGDTDWGHISERHPDIRKPDQRSDVEKKINKLRGDALRSGQVIYVEREKQKKQIKSIGTHEMFRLRYADTVRMKFKGFAENPNDSAGYFIMEPRTILSPLKEEQVSNISGNGDDANIPPKILSGARVILGYVSDTSDKNGSGCWDIGKGDFQKLAGRIAFNMAVEKPDGSSLESRFLAHNNGCAVPLKILGGPKASAVEYYLDQSQINKRHDGGTLITYGDLPGVDPSGELRGRKFYLNQPAATEDKSCYEETSAEINKDKLATLARFISRPGSKFLFKLRFRDLRSWELASILLCLQPENVAKLSNLPLTITSYLEKLASVSGENKFALKLGYGRPLGMGSIKIDVDDFVLLEPDQFDSSEILNKAFRNLSEKLQPIMKHSLLQWLKVQQYTGRTKAFYPQKNGKIFDFHTDIRANHAKGRRYAGLPRPEQKALSDLT